MSEGQARPCRGQKGLLRWRWVTKAKHRQGHGLLPGSAVEEQGRVAPQGVETQSSQSILTRALLSRAGRPKPGGVCLPSLEVNPQTLTDLILGPV